jgi:hypothetical protein
MKTPLLRLAEACRGRATDATHVFVRSLVDTYRLKRLSRLRLLGGSVRVITKRPLLPSTYERPAISVASPLRVPS